LAFRPLRSNARGQHAAANAAAAGGKVTVSVRSTKLVALLLFATIGTSSAQSILTVAGGGTDDGRPATVAGLNIPSGVALDASINLYIADTYNNRIRRVAAASGIITTVAGNGSASFSGDGGPATTASLLFPEGVALDVSGNVYIADSGNGRIRRVAAGTGIISTVAGNGSAGFSGDGGQATAAALWLPYGVALDSAGNLYIADYYNSRVRKVAAGTGIITTMAGNGAAGFAGDGGPATGAVLNGAAGVAVDTDGNLYIADYGNQRIRKVAAVGGIITTVAGNGSRGFSGDRGSATSAELNAPAGAAIDVSGNLYIADYGNGRIRRVAVGSGIISTFAGGDSPGFSGDGGPATAAEISQPLGIGLDRSGNLYVADSYNMRIRRVDAGNGIISTVAGNGRQGILDDDGGPATAAIVVNPFDVAVNALGDLYVADYSSCRIRKVDGRSRIISTVAGDGSRDFSGDGAPATTAGVPSPYDVTLDASGNLYIADFSSRIRRVDAKTGFISTVAGTGTPAFSGDGGPATNAALNKPQHVAFDDSGNMYIADTDNNRIRRIATASGMISTVAGTGNGAFSGDGGPATNAAIAAPQGVAVDVFGNLYIADTGNRRIRKVAASSGMISTVAGNGSQGYAGDGGPATAAAINAIDVARDAAGNLYITEGGHVRKVDLGSGIISTVAGNGFGFSGDGGFATRAEISASGAALDRFGNLYIADTFGSRVRAVFACVAVRTPILQQPSSGSASVAVSPRLSWGAVDSVFHYDIYLDTVNPPRKIVAADVVAPTYNPSNLEPLTTYYWKVVAKGDPFCPVVSTANSEVFSFTTAGSCGPPAPFTGSVAVGGSTATISWVPSARASAYDIFLGTSNPPRFYAQNVTATTLPIAGLTAVTTYNWKVVAHASCDEARTTETSVGSFTTAGVCGGAGLFTTSSPNDGDTAVPSTATLAWQASSGAASYDVYLGSGSSPPLYMNDLEQTSLLISRLSPGARYTWKVVAKAACDLTKSVASPVRHFMVAGCGVPVAPSGIAAQTRASIAGTYSIQWNDSAGLDAGGSYLVERATDSAFGNVIDHQQTTATSVSFVTRSAGTYYHRIRSVAGCDSTKRSAPSESVQVTVNAAIPMVVFSVLPQAVITKLGDKLEDQKTSFALENLGTSTVQVLVGPQLTGSLPFFTIVDPFGGDSSFVTLEPHKPKALDIHYSGPSNTQPGSYQGGIYVMSTGVPLAFTPQAYVNLKVGGDTNAVAPKLLVNGLESEFAYFPPVTGDDAARPAIQVDLLNSGTVPMEVAGEIGPEAWLKMEKDWNSSPVPVSAFRTLRLSTQRTKAVSGSALPRYTYLTVRNKAGQSARLLVEDSGGITNAAGRSAPLGAGEMSAIVPYVASGTAILLTNSGSDPVPVDLVFTPEGSDGFDATTVLRASIVIPPNDVVSLTDPLVQIFGKTTDAIGSIEILSAKLSQLAVRTEGRRAASGGGVYTTSMPVAMRGEGARIGSVHRVAGIASSASTKTSLIVTETSGREKTTAHVALYDNSGTKRGEQTIDLGRYGTKRIDDVAQSLAGGASLTAARADIDVPSGGGAIIALAIVSDRASGAGAAIIANAITREAHLSSLGRPIRAEATASATANIQTFTIPGAITNSTLKTTIGVSALASATSATVALRDGTTGQTTKQTISVTAGQTSEVDIPTGFGTVTVTTDAPVSLYARVRGTNIADALPVLSTYSEGLTGGGSAMPLYADGLEHSIDATRGRKTSLILTEIAGQSATINVRLYEPGSRTAAVAEKDFTIGANGELRLDNLFVSMGLESRPDDLDQRRKNEINVVAIVTATSGNGVIAAQAVMTDNKTGDRRTIQFVPVGGVPATTAQRSATGTPPPTRRRAVGK
jgi:sugar lactone lactonase YvrE